MFFLEQNGQKQKQKANSKSRRWLIQFSFIRNYCLYINIHVPISCIVTIQSPDEGVNINRNFTLQEIFVKKHLRI